MKKGSDTSSKTGERFVPHPKSFGLTKAKASGCDMRKAMREIVKDNSHIHRGVWELEEHGLYLIFGNDGIGVDLRTVQEVAYLREKLEAAKIEEVAFAVEPKHKFTWVMLVRGGDYIQLRTWLWDGWFAACGLSKSE